MNNRLWKKVTLESLRCGALLLTFLPYALSAQGFTNSATLSASVAGTNLLVTYSMSNTQGWVTLFQAGSLWIPPVMSRVDG